MACGFSILFLILETLTVLDFALSGVKGLLKEICKQTETKTNPDKSLKNDWLIVFLEHKCTRSKSNKNQNQLLHGLLEMSSKLKTIQIKIFNNH